VGKAPGGRAKIKNLPAASQRYDQSTVIWLQFTTAVRDKTSNRYDPNWGHNVDLNIFEHST
jgi:hypothetical protein